MQLRKNKNAIIRNGLNTIRDERKLIFERQLGHKADLPGSGQWRQLIRDDHKCWVCEESVYTICFWTKKFGQEDSDSITATQEEMLIDRIEMGNNFFAGTQFDGPCHLSQMTGWRPMPMMKLTDFCYALDS